ncbi:MAG: DNA repair protein RecO, partial [SAR324 cluster bacterium]|nr:DNA repair protein RecO [SAR324 cluster bacterium]
MQLNFQGIVIQKYDCGDTHLVIHVMSSNHGKLSILAKHARKSSKRFGTKIDLFDQGTFSISKQSNAMPSLTNFEALGGLKKLRSDMDKLILASVLAESVDILVKEESQHDGPIYSALTLGLAAIDEASSLKDSLRAACFSLSHILAQAGISDMKKHN